MNVSSLVKYEVNLTLKEYNLKQMLHTNHVMKPFYEINEQF